MSATLFAAAKHQSQQSLESGKFQNSEQPYQSGLGDLLKISKAYFTADRKSPTPTTEPPLRTITEQELLTDRETPVIYRLGHSSMLIRLDAEYLLIDPVFSDRASPVQWMGPKRFHPVPVALDSLPSIKAVIISHDHYDHLDKASIQALADRVEHFLTPLGVGQYLRDWGIDSSRIKELDWWQQDSIGTLTFTATPAQHFSGRGLMDRDQTLWAGWAIEGRQAKLFFSGDSGYFSGFKEIGERLGPFDLTMIETGAYNRLWSKIHMLPEQSVQAHIDLKGKAMLPIHNSTFDLALHDWHEPLEQAYEISQRRAVKLLTPIMGEPVSILNPAAQTAWWREVLSEDTPQLAME
ncbi:MBL fold metallo-hydrolase [Motiliproteus sp.]|uniref:MBL fold metallo-hydrolase n=1 Tax=Motiliproteus sp. TaxID=1898955 RepID=UPI003BAB2790